MTEYESVNPLIENPDWKPLHDLRPDEPVTCPRCGTTLLEVVRPYAFQTDVRCVTCKIQFVVHDG